MKIRSLAMVVASCVLVGSAVAGDNELTTKEKMEGYKLLFEGKTLTGWKSQGRAEAWAVEDGAIGRVGAGGNMLASDEQFENFILQLDYKVNPRVNSGIFLRWSNLKDPVNTGIEVQVYDSHGREKPGKHDDGALYDLVAPSKNMSKPAGEWNHAVITCDGPIIRVGLNGEKICEMNLNQYKEPGKNPDGTNNKFTFAWKDLPRKGHLGFQDHGGKVWFKNVKIKELASKKTASLFGSIAYRRIRSSYALLSLDMRRRKTGELSLR